MSGLLSLRPVAPPEPTTEAAAAPSVVVDALTQYVLARKSDAISHKNTYVSTLLLDARRMYAGEYDAETKTAIQALGGSQIYFNITRTIVDNSIAWLSEVIYRGGSSPWSVKPTPSPEVSPEIAQRVAEQVALTSPMPQSPQEAQALIGDRWDEIAEALRDEAQKCADRLSTLLQDQQAEGGFHEALSECLRDLCVYPACFLKGPFLAQKDEVLWEAGDSSVRPRAYLRWARVSPWNVFPAPNARSTDDGYLFEREIIAKHEIARFREVPGWNADAIDRALKQAPTGSPTSFAIVGETERQTLSGLDMGQGGGYAADTVELWRFYGRVSGELLTQWGATVEDAGAYYAAEVVLIGETVVRAVLNSDPLGRCGIHSVSAFPDPDSIWGRSFPHVIQHEQRAINALARALVNNSVLSSCVLRAIDLDAVDKADIPSLTKPLQPGDTTTFRGNSSNSSSRNPVTFHQPQINTQGIRDTLEYLVQAAHSLANIPKFASGDGDIQGAGQTATGLRMLKDASFKTIRSLISRIEQKLIMPTVEYQHAYTRRYLPDPAIEGDFTILTSGLTEKLLKEESLQGRKEFLSLANNPTDAQIIGAKQRAAVWRTVATELGFDEDDVVMSDESLDAAEQQAAMMAQQQAMMQQQPPMQAQGGFQ